MATALHLSRSRLYIPGYSRWWTKAPPSTGIDFCSNAVERLDHGLRNRSLLTHFRHYRRSFGFHRFYRGGESGCFGCSAEEAIVSGHGILTY